MKRIKQNSDDIDNQIIIFAIIKNLFLYIFPAYNNPNPNSLLTEIKLIFIRRYKTFFLYNLSTKIIITRITSLQRDTIFLPRLPSQFPKALLDTQREK